MSFACSSEKANTDDESSTLIPDVIVLGRTTDAIIQGNITSGNTVTPINLTQQLGVHPDSRLTPISNNSNLIGYYHFPQGPYGDYNVWEKDIDTEAFSEYATLCGLVFDQPYYFPKAFENIITVFSTAEGPDNSPILSLKIYDKNSETCSQINLGSTAVVQRPLRILKGNYILTYHVNAAQESIITKINISTGAIEDELIHSEQVSAVLQNNTIHVYIQASGLQHLTYNFDTFGFNGASTASTSLFIETGLFETVFDGSEMLIDIPYLQPSQFSQGPALLNLNSGEFRRIVDIPVVKANLENFINTEEQLGLSDFYEVDLINNIIVGGYYISNGNTFIRYGIYYANLDGTILTNIDLDFLPEKIIFR